MKQVLLILFLFSFCINSFSQKNEKIIEFTFDTISFKYPDFEVNEKTIDGLILRATVINNITKKEVAEFLRITNNTYYFTQKNDSNKIITEGKVVLQKTPFKKIKINKYDTNGEVDGYAFYNYYRFTKEGIWYDKLSDRTCRYGKYSNNKKDSIWNYTKTISHSIGILEKAVTYNTDKIINETSLNILSKSTFELEKAIIGKWTVDNSYNPNDSIIAFRKAENNNLNKISLTFYKNGECKMIGKGHHKSTSQIYNWVYKNSEINITLDSKVKFKIKNMNKGYLVLYILQV